MTGGRYRAVDVQDMGFVGHPSRHAVEAMAPGRAPQAHGGRAPREQAAQAKPLDMAEVLSNPSLMSDPLKLQELMRHPGIDKLKSELLSASLYGQDQNAKALLDKMDQQQQNPVVGATGMTGRERYAGVVPESRQVRAPAFNPFGGGA